MLWVFAGFFFSFLRGGGCINFLVVTALFMGWNIEPWCHSQIIHRQFVTLHKNRKNRHYFKAMLKNCWEFRRLKSNLLVSWVKDKRKSKCPWYSSLDILRGKKREPYFLRDFLIYLKKCWPFFFFTGECLNWKIYWNNYGNVIRGGCLEDEGWHALFLTLRMWSKTDLHAGVLMWLLTTQTLNWSCCHTVTNIC